MTVLFLVWGVSFFAEIAICIGLAHAFFDRDEYFYAAVIWGAFQAAQFVVWLKNSAVGFVAWRLVGKSQAREGILDALHKKQMPVYGSGEFLVDDPESYISHVYEDGDITRDQLVDAAETAGLRFGYKSSRQYASMFRFDSAFKEAMRKYAKRATNRRP